MGVVKVYCDKSDVAKEERYRGVLPEEVEALQTDPEIEVKDVQPSESYEGTFDVVAARSQQVEKFVCVGVPPEEIRISKDCRTIDDVRFIAHVVERTRSDLISEGWPKAEVMRLPVGGRAESDGEKASRHSYDMSHDDSDAPDASQERVEVVEAYARMDFDGDGVSEYRRILKAGEYVHENDVTDDHPFAVFSPILMPYKLVGLSFYDLIEDLQRIKTALTRQVLDNVYLANMPMKEVVEGKVNLDDLLNPRLGGLVRVKEVGSVREMPTQFIADSGLALINTIDNVRDTRTGVTETNSALNAEALAKGQVGSEGVQSLMQAGAQRQKLIARVLAETGLKRMHLLMLKLVCQYQDTDAQIRVNGRWLQMNPREWRTNYRVSVRVGLGSQDKAQEIANLTMLGQAQEKALALGLVQPQNVHYLLSRMVNAMGYRDPDKYFSQPNPNPPPPPPDPALMLEQVKQQGAQALAQLNGQLQAQLAQVKSQTDIQTEQMKQQAQDAQMQRELTMQAERDRMKLEAEMELERYKAEMAMRVDLQKAQIARETAIETARIGAQASVVGQAMRPEPSPNE